MSTTVLLALKGRGKVVLKIAPHMVVPQYAEEAYQLNLLRDWGLPVPEVYACNVGNLDVPHSYLLMQQMPGMTLADARANLSEEELSHIQQHLAEITLSLHARTNGHYKKISDGGEEGTPSYLEFFHGVYDPILKDVLDMKLLAAPLRRRVGAIHDKVDGFLRHEDKPRLIHGDLWASNLMVQPDKNGRWWVSGVLDPNCRFSHVELELAYLELFKTATPAFFRVYEQTHKLSPEYRRFRRDLYMLYPLLNHVRIFGPQYAKPLAVVADRLSTEISARRRKIHDVITRMASELGVSSDGVQRALRGV